MQLWICRAGKCLHDVSGGTNPYIQVMSVICKALSNLDEDKQIPAYGFGGLGTIRRYVLLKLFAYVEC